MSTCNHTIRQQEFAAVDKLRCPACVVDELTRLREENAILIELQAELKTAEEAFRQLHLLRIHTEQFGKIIKACPSCLKAAMIVGEALTRLHMKGLMEGP